MAEVVSMSDFTQWNERRENAIALLLDPLNPRLPDIGHAPQQRDIAAELVNHYDVYGLAKDIVEKGYFPTEVLIGLEDDGNQIIVEGNRRLAAVKLLLSPDLAPEGAVKRFRTLHSRVIGTSIERLRVVFAPSRADAAPLIINRHTTTGVERWKPVQQAKYLSSFVAGDVALGTLASRLGITRGELSEALRMNTMYRLACALPLPDDVLKDVRDSRKFNASTLERLIQSPRTVDFLGLTFDERGRAFGGLHVDEFKKGYGRIISDITLGRIDTRELNTSDDIDRYLNGLGTDRPNRSRQGSFDSASLLRDGPGGRASSSATSKVSGRATVKPSASLIPVDIRCRLKSPRINEVFKELRRLKVADYPNACAVLLRVLLDLVLGYYLEKSGKIEPLLRTADRKNKPKDWFPELRKLLAAVLQDPDVKVPRQARRRLQAMLSEKERRQSLLDSMDQFVHNSYVWPTERELRGVWVAFEDLFRQLLVEPSQTANSPSSEV